MKVSVKSVSGYSIVILTGLYIAIALLVGTSFSSNSSFAAENITNQTVIAILNVTNTEPNITSVVLDDDTPTPVNEIDLTANNVTVVTCNATIFDFNGWDDIDPTAVNATVHLRSVGAEGPLDNNHRYRNESCGRCIEIDSTTAACDCRVPLQYYANYSNEWVCNMTIRDGGGTGFPGQRINFSDAEVSGNVTVTPLLAINTEQILDYGNLSVTETSAEILHNVSNVGNLDLNITIRSYGGSDETIPNANNLTMICEIGNITLDQQRYEFGTHKIGTTVFSDMVRVTNQTVPIVNSTLKHKIEDDFSGAEQNSSLWRLQIPFSAGGFCNGTLVFGAVESEQE